jgi:hypothetical protein
MLFRRVAAVVMLLLLFITFIDRLKAQQHQDHLRLLNLDHGIILRYPANWSPAEPYFSNANELVAPLGLARTLITATRETDHARAMRRLADVAAEVAAPSQFLSIAGWPGLERHYVFRRGRTGQTSAAQGRGEAAWRVTTAIAAGDVLVRLETIYQGETHSPFEAKLKDQILHQAAHWMGRLILVRKRGMPDDTQREIEILRKNVPNPSALTPSAEIRGEGQGSGELASSSDQQAVAVGLEQGELEIAASRDGKTIVIVANSGYAVSYDGGPFSATSWTSTAGPFPFKHKGDPSITVGLSKAFYYAYIGLPEGEVAAKNAIGCSTGIGKSVDDGKTFHFLNHAVLCPKTGVGKCLPDQAHIAADQKIAGPNGADQLYSVYRTCNGLRAERSCEETSTWCRGKPSIVCSKDGGETWTRPFLIENSGSADFPRITVAPDGFVYVIYRNGNLLKLAKYGSCASGLVMEPGFPLIIPVNNTRLCADDEGLDRCHCPIAGIDRCNNGNLLSSPTVAVDDTNSSRIYAAFTVNSIDPITSARNDDVVVKASTDGGLTWPHEATINAIGTGRLGARRFMPWLCSVNGRAYVTWYDRGFNEPFNDNSLTNYYLGMGTFAGEKLTAGRVRNLSGKSDPHCGYWPTAPRSKDDAEACQIQPQMAGWCGTDDGKQPSGDSPRCDFGCGPGACRSCKFRTDICRAGDGVPKYGDYNGNACAAGRVFAAWASRTPPAGPSLDAEDHKIRIYSITVSVEGPP